MTPRAAAGLLLLLAACGAPRPAPVTVPEPDPGEVERTVFLVGDAGSPDAHDDPTFAALEAAARAASDRAIIVFLGDNVYPAGLPPEGHPGRTAAERVLGAQLAAARRAGVPARFLLGNHDWRASGEGDDGPTAVRRQAEWIAARSGGQARVMPGGACPGPAVEDFGGLRLVFLDTEWWLHDRGGPAPVAGCEPSDSAGVTEALAAAIAGAQDRPVLVLGHHPLASGGRHGGHFGWRHHLFPLTELARWAWLPLPLVGSLYPVLRSSGVSDQDFSGARNRAMRGALDAVFAAHPPALYAAGHEHTLQVIGGRRPPLLLVSGNGSTGHGTWVGWTDSTRYASIASGWIRVDLLPGGRLRVGVTEVDGRGAAHEAWSDVVAATAPGATPPDDGFTRIKGARAGERVTVAAGRYEAGWLHRVLFGSRYRDLWTTPIQVPVLDLDREAGGLVAERVGGGRQTRSLRLRALDGREFAFRSVDKDPAAALPGILRGTLAEEVARDQTSAGHPLAGLLAAPILDAAGVVHAPPRLFVMPDDPRLGEFRAEFGGLLGTLEERPSGQEDGAPAFGGALEVKSTEKMLEAVMENPRVPVDARAFLAARLLDLYLGDWDRHADQWRWALVPGGRERTWIPIPRDRDQAFSRYDGLVLALARRVRPELLEFGPEYASPFAATWVGRHLDRRLLSGLERAVWDSSARALQAALTDPVLDAAVARQPPEYAAEAPRLRAALAARRDGLPAYAGRVYELLAREVDIHASDRSDDVTVQRRGDSADVVIRNALQGVPAFVRRFHRSETGELRIHLGRDRDLARVLGAGSIRVRVIGDQGPDRMIAEPGVRRVKFYDTGDRTVAEGAPLSRRPPPAPPPVRDWGSRMVGDGFVLGSTDLGVVPTVRITRERYGFRQAPYARRVRAALSYSTGQQAVRALLDVEDPLESSTTVLTLRALASGLESIRFYGLGNGTTDDRPQEFYRVNQHVVELRPGVRFRRPRGWRVELAAAGRVVRTEAGGENAGRIIGEAEPFGTGTVGRAGGIVSFERDSRDRPLGARTGGLVRARAAAWPLTWGDAAGGFGIAAVDLHGHLTPGDGAVTLAARTGGRAAWGDAPFDELAFLGGLESLRGYRQNRFAGEQAAFAAGELRLRAARFRTLVPGEFGIFAAGDVGRVFSAGGGSETWHRSAGGGAYFAFLDRALVLVGGAARSTEGTLAYFGVGFPD